LPFGAGAAAGLLALLAAFGALGALPLGAFGVAALLALVGEGAAGLVVGAFGFVIPSSLAAPPLSAFRSRGVLPGLGWSPRGAREERRIVQRPWLTPPDVELSLNVR
jgi:hypothetical protein